MKGAAALALVLVGCVASSPVERRYDGRVLQGRFVEPKAYAAFLRGAIAEAGGGVADAIAAYEAAAELDAGGTESWTRLGAVRCGADPRDRRADDAFGRALRLDGLSARTWEAMAKCAHLRGDGAGARAAAERAASLDAAADDANVLLAESAAPGHDSMARDQLVSLTLTAADPRVAWDALRRWAACHGDVALWVRALGTLVRLDPSQRDEAARVAEQLAGSGEIALARTLAAAAAGGSDQPLLSSRHPLASRLAVDEAIAGDDAGAVSARASRVRLSIEEAAARALLAGKAELARELAETVVRADPSDRGASLVLAAAERRDVIGAARASRDGEPAVSGAVLVAFGAALVHAASPSEVGEALRRIAREPIVDGDDRVVRPAVDLVARGVLPAAVLTADGAVELAAMGLDIRPAAPAEGSRDARHEYLALALERPADPRTRELGARLARLRSSDPVVAAAAAIAALAAGGPIDHDAARALLAIDPSDPLLAATALHVADKVGDAEVARHARAALRAGAY